MSVNILKKPIDTSVYSTINRRSVITDTYQGSLSSMSAGIDQGFLVNCSKI